MPRLSAGGLQVSSLEAITALCLAVGTTALVAGGHAIAWRSPLALPALTGLGLACLAALLAPAHQGNALRFCGRLVAAASVAGLTANVITTRALARLLVGVLLAVGLVVGVLAVLEVQQDLWVLHALKTFRPGFHVVGGQVRATATFIYPTVASMYLEVVFALGLWFLVEPPVPARPRLSRLLAGTALAIVAAGVVATFTRAGLIALAVSLGGVSLLWWRRQAGFDLAQRSLAALALVVALLTLASRSPQAWMSRVSTDTAQDWYGARYDVPARLSIAAGTRSDVPVSLTNDGMLTWQSERPPVFAVAYHWLTADTDLVVEFEGARTPFASPVAPGEQTTLPVAVWAPREAGDYVLVWDVVHEGRAWLSTEGVPSPRTAVRVTGVPPATPPLTHGRLPGAATRMPRLTLWRAAAAIAAAHPILGIGPDNFRQVYGEYLGLAAWDRRVHANSLYFEALTGAGLGGLAAIVWFVIAALRHLWRQTGTATAGPLAAAVLMAGVAMAGHGLVDAFLAFTPTYLIFALAAGLAGAPVLDHAVVSHAHRV